MIAVLVLPKVFFLAFHVTAGLRPLDCYSASARSDAAGGFSFTGFVE